MVANLCEVFYVEMLLDMDFTMRAKAEGAAIFIKSVLVYYLIREQLGLLAYALGEVTMNLVIFVIYFTVKKNKLGQQQNQSSLALIYSQYFQMRPIVTEAKRNKDKGSYLSALGHFILPQHLQDLRQFTQLCFLKLILTEGEKIVISFSKGDGVLQQAGEFGLISNLISIVCRFIFRPIEEITFNLFAKFKMDDKQAGTERRDKKDSEEITRILVQYLAGVVGIGISAVVFSQFCSEDFIFLLYSQRWATKATADIMRAYCICLLFMALNGIAEAFAYGLANRRVLNSLQNLLIANSVVYLALVMLLYNAMGVTGLIWANAVNMAVRGIWSLKISLDSLNDPSPDGFHTSLLKILAGVATHKVFIALTCLGIFGTAIATKLLAIMNTRLYPSYVDFVAP